MIDSNSWTFHQLKTLVGIGDTYAKRIVDARSYQCMDDLVTRKVIPRTNYNRIMEHIMTRLK